MNKFLAVLIALGLMVPAILMVYFNYEPRPGSRRWVSICLTIGKLLLEALDGVLGFANLQFVWFGMFAIGFMMILLFVLGLFFK